MITRITIYLLFVFLFVYAGETFAFTEGSNNNYFGIGAGGASGSQNALFGASAGDVNTGSYNTFLGHKAGYSNDTGSNNTFIGYLSGYNNTTNSQNTFLGYRSGYNTTGGHNTFIGHNAGYSTNTGYNNVFLGRNAGYTNATGVNNVFLGHDSGYYETGSNKLYIDNSDTTSPLIYGEFNNSFVEINGDFYVTGNTYVDSDIQVKKSIRPIRSPIDKIKHIQGVSFAWNDAKGKGSLHDIGRHYGVIAQDVENVLPEVVRTGRNGNKKVSYMELIPVLIEAVKEQHKIVEQQQKTLTEMTEEIKAIKRKLQLKGALAMLETD